MLVRIRERSRSRKGLTAHHAATSWLPLSLSPFLVGAVVKVFPVDKGAAIGFAALVFGAALAGSLALRRYRPATTLSIGATVIAAIVAMPFFLPWSSGQEASSAPAAPVYSFKEAKANPAAFARWWSFFVDEVVRTNALVFEKDPNSAPVTKCSCRNRTRPRTSIRGALPSTIAAIAAAI